MSAELLVVLLGECHEFMEEKFPILLPQILFGLNHVAIERTQLLNNDPKDLNVHLLELAMTFQKSPEPDDGGYVLVFQ